MDTQEINTLLNSDEYSQPIFGGTLARDHFQSQYAWSPSRLFVINTDPSSMPGEHWLAVFRGDEDTFLFDSYGLNAKLFYPEIVSTLVESDNMHPITSGVTLQSLLSDVCGDYCVLFGLALSRGVSFQGFLDYWKESYSANTRDTVVRTIVSELMK